MLPPHKQALIAQRDVIVKDLNVQDVFSVLRSNFVLTKSDEERILLKTTNKEQAELLLNILPLKDSIAFNWFLRSLIEKYSHLECALRRELGSSGDDEGSHPMTQDHRDLLTAKREEIMNDLLVGDILPHLMAKFVFHDDDQQVICAEKTDKLKAAKLLDLLPTRGDAAFGHFVDALRSPSEHLAQLLVTDDEDCIKLHVSVESGILRELSKERNQWLVVGQILRLVREPLVLFVAKVMKTWHERLRSEASVQLGACTSPPNCLKQKRVQDLCSSCSAWYYTLAANHRNQNKSLIRWRQNCDTSRWQDDPWEVAKFFMSALGDSKGDMKDAESTDLTSLLNVLEWVKDEAFGETKRIPVAHVTKLREVRNALWAHSAKQEVTKEQLNQAGKVADEFLVALSDVSVNGDVRGSRSLIHSLFADDLTGFQACEDNVDHEMDEVVLEEGARSSDGTTPCGNKEKVENLTEQVKVIQSMLSKILTEFRTTTDINRKEAKLKKCLPEQSSSFIGRKVEIEQAISFIVEKKVGIVWIVGGPGFGKSTTAVEIAHGLYDHHHIPQVFFADLRVTTTVHDVIIRICHAMGIHLQQDPRSSLLFALKGLTNNRVLVMDNIEQLLCETTKDHFVDLMRLLRMESSQYLQILLTSTLHFPVVDLKSEVITLPILDRNSSVELVRKCHPEKCDDHFVDSLARLCGDVPLALSIAASRLQDVPDPKQLLQWLEEDPLEVLTTPGQEPIVEKSIAMSFNMLSNEHKNFLVRLSVFGGNFGEEAVQEITGLAGIKLRNFLTALVNRNLMERRNDRYSIHTLILSFLRNCTSGTGCMFSSERNLAQRKMVEYFLRRADELTLLYWSKDGSTNARRLLQEDAHNIDSVLQLCRESVEKKPANAGILQSLRESTIYQSSSKFFCHFVIHILSQATVRSFLDACADTARQHKDAAVELLIRCLISYVVGRSTGWKSQEYLKSIENDKETFCRNEELLDEESNLEAISYYWYNQFMYAKESPSVEKARSHLQSYLELKRNHEGLSHLEEVDVAITLLQLGRVHRRRATESDAVQFYKEASELFERLLGDHDLKLCCHKELGDLHREQGKLEEAVPFYENAMKVHRKLGASNSNISSVYLLKNYGLSLPCVEESIAYQREALDAAEKLFPDYGRCKTDICCDLAKTFDKRESGCEDAVEFAKKALTGLRLRQFSNMQNVDLEVERTERIIAKGNNDNQCD